MRYLLDTNVLSELSKDTVAPLVSEWFASKDPDSLLISVITIGEVVYGIEKMEDSRRKERIEAWFEKTLLDWFEGNICVIDSDTMRCWGHIKATTRTLPILDSLIAATAISNNATLVTRNAKDFDGIDGLNVVNPFTA